MIADPGEYLVKAESLETSFEIFRKFIPVPGIAGMAHNLIVIYKKEVSAMKEI